MLLDPLSTPISPTAQEAIELNVQSHHQAARDVIRMAVQRISRLAVVSSFGADSVVLLHLVSKVAPELPILFIDTEMLFAETLSYQQEVSRSLGLKNVIVVKADDIARKDPSGTLHRTDTDACCHLRKTVPLQQALSVYDGWISGRKRFQSAGRAALQHFEAEASGSDLPGRIKVNPLAFWSAAEVAQYMETHNLPRHPLVEQGYPSIGCAPCTTPVKAGEDPRAGRWRHKEKDECGIHIVDGKVSREGAMN